MNGGWRHAARVHLLATWAGADLQCYSCASRTLARQPVEPLCALLICCAPSPPQGCSEGVSDVAAMQAPESAPRPSARTLPLRRSAAASTVQPASVPHMLVPAACARAPRRSCGRLARCRCLGSNSQRPLLLAAGAAGTRARTRTRARARTRAWCGAFGCVRFSACGGSCRRTRARLGTAVGASWHGALAWRRLCCGHGGRAPAKCRGTI